MFVPNAYKNTTLMAVSIQPLGWCLVGEAFTFYAIEDLRRRRALPITDTELKLMASAASMGDSRMPKNGKSTPAAIGTPMVL